jgi:hypothetical protein
MIEQPLEKQQPFKEFSFNSGAKGGFISIPAHQK